MKKIEKKGKQKSDTSDGNTTNEATNASKVKDENDKPLNYIKDEIQSESMSVWVVGVEVAAEVRVLWPREVAVK